MNVNLIKYITKIYTDSTISVKQNYSIMCSICAVLIGL